MPKIPEILVEVKWKGQFWFLPTRILGIIFDRTGPTEFAIPFLTNPLTAMFLLCREFGKGIKNGKGPIPLG